MCVQENGHGSASPYERTNADLQLIIRRFYIGSTDNLRQRLRQHQADVDAYAAWQSVAAARDRVVDSMVGKSFLRDTVVGHE